MKTRTKMALGLLALAVAAPVFALMAAAPQRMIAEHNNFFATELYAKLSETDGNLFFSPHSISTALAMTYAGAEGATAEQMAAALRFTLPAERLHPAFGRLSGELMAPGQPYELAIANRLWGLHGMPFEEPFLATTREHYGAELVGVDFAGDAEGARRQINAWVAEQTRDKILDLIPPGVLDALTRLVLTNAIYFKGTWAAQFDPADTEEQPFHKADGSTVQAPLMFQKGKFRYHESPGEWQLVRLPYEGERLEMVVLLPAAESSVAALEASLGAAELDQWINSARRRDVKVWLPKFQMESMRMLSQPMTKLGMVDAFSNKDADFDGIAKGQSLYITAIIHKAFVDVNEEGTEAAAATAVVIGARSVPPPPAEFRADRPFLFLIRDAETGSLLFVGRVMDPTG